MSDVKNAVKSFLSTDATSGQFGKYIINGNKLVYRTMVTNEIDIGTPERREKLMKAVELKQVVLLEQLTEGSWRVKVRHLAEDLIAVKLPDLILGNSAVLPLIGRIVAFGNVKANRLETEVQQLLAEKIPMLPFNVFNEAGLSVADLKIIEQAKPETVTRKVFKKHDKKGKPIYITESVHFTGASLFSINEQCFLFDLDRRELEHNVFNPFLVKLPKPVKTIADAYASLKPKEVIKAEREGLKVKRQGEWFFIPVTSKDQLDKLEKESDKVTEIVLQAGNNRPNYAKGLQLHNDKALSRKVDENLIYVDFTKAQKINQESEFFVTGKVEHAGREHADLTLSGWFKAVPNTATDSFTITGDVD